MVLTQKMLRGADSHDFHTVGTGTFHNIEDTKLSHFDKGVSSNSFTGRIGASIPIIETANLNILDEMAVNLVDRIKEREEADRHVDAGRVLAGMIPIGPRGKGWTVPKHRGCP